MGGWVSEITQGTKITPSVVKSALQTMETFVEEFNNYLTKNGVSTVTLGNPLGSTAYYRVDPENKEYGDLDLQVIVPDMRDLVEKSPSQVQSFWTTHAFDFVNTRKPAYVHPNSSLGHPIVFAGDNNWVQIDLIPHAEPISTWGRFRLTPERGIKGMLLGNMYSVLGDLLMLSIQGQGVQYKFRDNSRQPFAKTMHSKDKGRYELRVITTNIETFVRDIFDYEYKTITDNDPTTSAIHPLLAKNPGLDLESIKIKTLADATMGLAKSFEMNYMFGKAHLERFSGHEDFINQFVQEYEVKAMKDVNSTKREKASTPEAVNRAERDRQSIINGLEMVKGYFEDCR
jgi:hypothetical protein